MLSIAGKCIQTVRHTILTGERGTLSPPAHVKAPGKLFIYQPWQTPGVSLYLYGGNESSLLLSFTSKLGVPSSILSRSTTFAGIAAF